ncbi:hypothetical protein ACIQUL_34130 [Streptomyces sp. NPDC090303]|uniref:hypothetical protein n=1 Tax=Streptomyces sp. NPDC090303 TaxID=3365960 RepID=UPI00380BED31
MSMSEQDKAQCVARCFEGISARVERGVVDQLVQEYAVGEFEANEAAWFTDCLVELLVAVDPEVFAQCSAAEILTVWNRASDLARAASGLVEEFTGLANNFKVLQMSLADITRENTGMLKGLSPGYSHPVALVRSRGHRMVIGGSVQDGPNHFQAVETLFQHLDGVKGEFQQRIAAAEELHLSALSRYLREHVLSQEWYEEMVHGGLSASFGYVTMERKGGHGITTLKNPGKVSVQGFPDGDKVFIEEEFARFTKKEVDISGDESVLDGAPDHTVSADVALAYQCRIEVTAGTGAPRGRYAAGSISEAIRLLSPFTDGFSIEEFYRGTEQYALSSGVEFGQAGSAKSPAQHSMQANGYQFDLQAGGDTGTGSQHVHLIIMIAPVERVDVAAANAEVLSRAAVEDALPFFMLEEHLKIFRPAESDGLQHLLYRMTAAAKKGTPLGTPLGRITKTSQKSFEVRPYLHARKSVFDAHMRRIQEVTGDFRYTTKSSQAKAKAKDKRADASRPGEDGRR